MITRFNVVLFFVACCSTVSLVSMMRSGGGSAGSGDVVVEVAPAGIDLRELVVTANPEGDVFEKIVAEMRDNLADEVRHRIGRLGRDLRPEDHSFLSVEYFRQCAAEAAAIRAGGEADDEYKKFVLLRKSRDLIKNIMEWMPARDVSYGSTEKYLTPFDQVPPVFSVAMSRDEVVVHIPNPYFLNQTGKTCLQLLHEDRPFWEKWVMLRPGATAEDPVDDEHAILLFRYLD